ncbi:hypothetical protein ACTQ34_13280 [Agathobaculum sp. LCP25S3_E8]|uniref:hypothetical protein n=1 Tax=Agathobaculum sp. LCP25S3_E8 TaxID=3438735 RepID=UPI003F8FB5D5
MRITVVGKVHRTGVSKKTGNNYNFIELHFVAPSRGVEGEAAQTVTMDPSVFPYDQIGRGLYNIDFDRNGNPLSLHPVQPPTSK